MHLLMGNEAIAAGALAAGVNVVSGYPGTPSTEVLETIAEYNPGGIHIEWSCNEKTALEVAAGAAFSGARALMTCKQVGLNVASDPLMTIVNLGVKGGLVLIVADDPGPISSQTEQDTRQFAQFAKVPVFDPSSAEEAYAMVLAAFEFSERYNVPAIVRPTTRIDHSNAAFDFSLDDAAAAFVPHEVSGFERDPHWVIFPPVAYAAHLAQPDKLAAMAADFAASPYNSLSDSDGLPGNPPFRLLKIGTAHPFPDALGRQFLDGLADVIVFEELEPVVERELLLIAGREHLPVDIHGKLTRETSVAGENSIDRIAAQLRLFLTELAQEGTGGQIGIAASGISWAYLQDVLACHPRDAAKSAVTSKARHTTLGATPEIHLDSVAPDLPARPPVLCAGCPHRASFAAVKKAAQRLKARSGIDCLFSGDIGCYTLGNASPLNLVDTCVCMGAGFTVPQGMHWAEPDKKHLGFVGDSTFFASALTGVANAVYNQTDVTLFVLDNATTAMTGTQPHPGTGVRMSNGFEPTCHSHAAAQSDADRANAISIPEVLKALGVKHIAVVDPFDYQAAIKAASDAIAYVGVSVVVFVAPCITVSKPRPRSYVEPEKCTFCRACINTLGCPALIVRDGKVAVDQSLCYGCTLCEQVCPFDAIHHNEAAK
jgi:indolepyruvate ferredoxin oxidoreductase alpha subunit